LVGATPDATSLGFANLIERGIKAELPNVVASGLEATSAGWQSWISADGRELPFDQNSFDLVFSNAVIEHVGGEQDQMRFIREHDRVGKSWILTTPNRLFPVESHTQILFSHMRKSWKHVLVSRLLSKRDLIKILPPGSIIKGNTFSPTFICYKVRK
jgi:2-polyprenyl-3-methyl-5-hydroxy-6-metoxy-1,4-benzoquinol methylase